MRHSSCILLFALLMGLVMVSCHKPSSSASSGTDDLSDFASLADTTILDGDTIVHAPMRYWDFDKVDSLMSFFNEVLSEHPFVVCENHESLMDNVGECIDQLEAYRRGERLYFPDSLVQSCIFGLVADWAVIYREFEPKNDRCFIEWLLMCAAYYSPDITWYVEGQTPDHNAGFLTIGNPYTCTPYCSYIILKQDKGYEVKCIGDDVLVMELFQLSDNQDRTYYLCSYNIPSLFGQWLYWENDRGEYLKVAEYTDTPDECEGNDIFRFDPEQLWWQYAYINDDADLVPLREEPALRLSLDGANSRFE